MHDRFPTMWDKSFDKYFIGSDRFMTHLKQVTDQLANTAITNFPPYNIKKVDDSKYVIEMAVAGFGKQDIEVVLEKNRLVIKGNTKADTDEANYLFKGIANRGFTRDFTLADNVVIDNAQLLNGMLKVWLEHVIPEDQKPKKIEIEDQEATTTVSKKKG
jgi:molecular chaperone IbpA